MKRILAVMTGMMVLAVFASGAAEAPTGLFKMSFKFQAGGQNLAPGEYRVGLGGEGHLVFHQVSTGKEVSVPFTEMLAPPAPPVEETRLVFAMVGNFEPSYTEYVTDYVLCEVWLDAGTGFLIRKFKGAHKTHTVKGRKAGSGPF